MCLIEPLRPLASNKVIIFPGAFVSPFAYSILARTVAQRGYPCFVLRLPFDLGVDGHLSRLLPLLMVPKYFRTKSEGGFSEPVFVVGLRLHQ